jgi:hypothetical protein
MKIISTLWKESRSIDIRCNSMTPNEPKYREVVRRTMSHGLRNVINLNIPCVENSECSKKFPKLFLQSRITDMDFFLSSPSRRVDSGRKLYL